MNDNTDSILRQLVVPLTLSIVAWLGWFAFTTLDNKRKDKLETVRSQIVDLYGPMVALSTTNDSVWKSLDRAHTPKFDVDSASLEDEIRSWRAVFKQVVQPLNGQMEQTFLSSKQVIRCPSTRDPLHQFVAFAESVKLMTSTWPESDLGDKTKKGNTPELPYPSQLSKLLSTELDALHERESFLDDGFFGLFSWCDPPSGCQEAPQIANPESEAPATGTGSTQASAEGPGSTQASTKGISRAPLVSHYERVLICLGLAPRAAPQQAEPQ